LKAGGFRQPPFLYLSAALAVTLLVGLSTERQSLAAADIVTILNPSDLCYFAAQGPA
jgi:hypothetical protein